MFRFSFIVGFPGETEEDFRRLLDFLDKIAFDYVGFFTYSREEDTLAGAMPCQVPEAVKEARYHAAMAHQRPVSLACQERRVGRTLEVLVEGRSPASRATTGDAGAARHPRWTGRCCSAVRMALSRGPAISCRSRSNAPRNTISWASVPDGPPNHPFHRGGIHTWNNLRFRPGGNAVIPRENCTSGRTFVAC